MKDRPHILYIFTDQQYAGAVSCAGNADLRTPALDRLAGTGVRFEKAYCTCPLCTPSRASMITGRMPHQVGITGNNQPIGEAFRGRGLGHTLSDAGYECAYGGKWHLPEGAIPEGHGFRSICGFSDRDLADRCIAFLSQPHDRPFFAVASFDNPHNICEWARQTPLPWGPIPEAPLEACPNLPPNYAIPAYEPEVLRMEQAAQPRFFRGLSFTDDDWRRYRHAYYRLVEKVDAEIGRVLDALRAAGLEEETLVIFSSDHGDGLGAHRWNQKWVLYEESVRVPLILSLKGRTAAPGRADAGHLVSNGLDLFPTICDYAGVEPPEGLPGLSLRPLAEGRGDIPWRDCVVAETSFDPKFGGLGTRGRMVRTERYKYIVYSWGKHREQLFDLETDPGEMVNLAVEARHQGVLARHRELLAAWVEKTGDRF